MLFGLMKESKGWRDAGCLCSQQLSRMFRKNEEREQGRRVRDHRNISSLYWRQTEEKHLSKHPTVEVSWGGTGVIRTLVKMLRWRQGKTLQAGWQQESTESVRGEETLWRILWAVTLLFPSFI